MSESLLDGDRQLLSIGSAESASLPISGVEHVHNAGVIPVLDVVVRPVVDLHFDRVSAIVDQEDDHRELEADHLAHLLRGELKGSVTDHQNDAPVWSTQRIPKGCRNRPADVAPLHFDLKPGSVGKPHVEPVEPGVSGFDEYGRIRIDYFLDLPAHLSSAQWSIRHRNRWRP